MGYVDEGHLQLWLDGVELGGGEEKDESRSSDNSPLSRAEPNTSSDIDSKEDARNENDQNETHLRLRGGALSRNSRGSQGECRKFHRRSNLRIDDDSAQKLVRRAQIVQTSILKAIRKRLLLCHCQKPRLGHWGLKSFSNAKKQSSYLHSIGCPANKFMKKHALEIEDKHRVLKRKHDRVQKCAIAKIQPRDSDYEVRQGEVSSGEHQESKFNELPYYRIDNERAKKVVRTKVLHKRTLLCPPHQTTGLGYWGLYLKCKGKTCCLQSAGSKCSVGRFAKKAGTQGKGKSSGQGEGT